MLMDEIQAAKPRNVPSCTLHRPCGQGAKNNFCLDLCAAFRGKKSRFQSHVRGIEAENSRTLRLSKLSSSESGLIPFYFLPDLHRQLRDSSGRFSQNDASDERERKLTKLQTIEKNLRFCIKWRFGVSGVMVAMIDQLSLDSMQGSCLRVVFAFGSRHLHTWRP